MLEAAIGNALGGIATVVTVYLYKRFISEKQQHLRLRPAFKIFILAFIIVFLTDFTPMPVEESIRVALFGPPSQNERLTLHAWEAYERRDYLTAISSADKVIDEYAGVAKHQEGELEQGIEPIPTIGNASPWAASKIFSRGLLNDVASCYWILGHSYESIGQGCKAK